MECGKGGGVKKFLYEHDIRIIIQKKNLDFASVSIFESDYIFSHIGLI